MKFDELNRDNFIFFAIKYYENPNSSTKEEFEEDIKRFKYVKRWLKKYHLSGDINSHLLLNHLIMIFNCWGEAAIPMLVHKIESDYWPYLKSFLEFMNRIPEYPLTPFHSVEEDLNIRKTLKRI